MLGQTSDKILANKLQRKLRNEMTDAERALWAALRGRQLSDLKFRRQHPYGDFIFDFVCLSCKLVIEVDGSQHDKSKRYDDLRTKKLEAAWFHVLRFWNNDVLQEIEAVKERIWQVVQEVSVLPDHESQCI